MLITRLLLAIIFYLSWHQSPSLLVESRFIDVDQRIDHLLGSVPSAGGGGTATIHSKDSHNNNNDQSSGSALRDHQEGNVEAASSGSNNNNNENKKHRQRHRHQPPTASAPRPFYLYNRCSGGHVQILGKTINALWQPDNSQPNYAIMSLQSQTFGPQDKPLFGVRIQAKKAGVYLCFNKKGRLVSRFNGGSVNCLFREIASGNSHIRFQSLLNPDWFMGFNRKGRPMKEPIKPLGVGVNPRRQKCYQFLKRPTDLVFGPNDLNSS